MVAITRKNKKSLKFKLVHGQTVCDEVAYQQCQNYRDQCQDQTVFIPHKIFSGILISGKQVFVVVQMHLGEIKIQGHTLHNYFTAFLEGSEETCKKRECDQHTEDSEKPCG